MKINIILLFFIILNYYFFINFHLLLFIFTSTICHLYNLYFIYFFLYSFFSIFNQYHLFHYNHIILFSISVFSLKIKKREKLNLYKNIFFFRKKPTSLFYNTQITKRKYFCNKNISVAVITQ